MAKNNVERMLVVWCPDWPVVATGLALSNPVAVMQANKVIACSPTAKRSGVHVGLRRREAQARCPELQIVQHDLHRDVAAFETVVSTIETLAPRVEVIEAGTCAIPTRGPSRYFGGDEALIQHFTMLIDETLKDAGWQARCCVGIADGIFAATMAARAAMVVPVGKSPGFLAPQPIDVLHPPELIDLLRRLGIRFLGDFAALPAADVLGRFGEAGMVAHRLAQGLDEQPFHARKTPLELSVSLELDPPVVRVDTAAFAAKSLAESLHQRLAAEGLACNRLAIEALTESGETLSRVWRHDGRLSSTAIAERVRWQLDGWLTSGGGDQTDEGFESSTGLVLLRLIPEGLLPDNGYQLGFWGGSVDADERTGRALARVQGLLGENAVLTAVLGGGRSPIDQVHLVPWGIVRDQVRPGLPIGIVDPKPANKNRKRVMEVPTWPGQLPAPAPATVYEDMPPAEVTDEHGNHLSIGARGNASGVPAQVSVEGGPVVSVKAWTGPWLIDERWWDSAAVRRGARLQLLTETGEALLVVLQKQKWWLEARYD